MTTLELLELKFRYEWWDFIVLGVDYNTMTAECMGVSAEDGTKVIKFFSVKDLNNIEYVFGGKPIEI